MVKLRALLLLSVWIWQFAAAQTVADTTIRKPTVGVVLGLDARNSVLGRHNVKIQGVKLGLHVNRWRFGGGYYWLSPSLRYSARLEHVDAPERELEWKVRFKYANLFIEREIFASYRWEWDVSLAGGPGSARLQWIQTDGSIGFDGFQTMGLVEPGTYVQVRVMKYFGIGAGGGYRFCLSPEPALRQAVASPFYLFRFKVFAGDIYHDVFNGK